MWKNHMQQVPYSNRDSVLIFSLVAWIFSGIMDPLDSLHQFLFKEIQYT